MLRKESEAVPEGNGPVPRQEEFGSGQPTLEDVYRMTKEVFEEWDTNMDELLREQRGIDQRLTRRSMTLGSHVLPWRQTGPQTQRFASARRASLQQYKRCMGIAFLLAGLIPAR